MLQKIQKIWSRSARVCLRNFLRQKCYTKMTGVLSMDWAKDGTLITAGRDRLIKLWKVDGSKLSQYSSGNTLPLSVHLYFKSKTLLMGGFDGFVHQAQL